MIPAAVIVAADDAYAQRAQFYADVAAGLYAKAADEGEAYLTQHPGDEQFALDVAYAELSAGRREKATARFQALAKSQNATVAKAASNQLAAMSLGNRPYAYSPDRGYAYASSDYESRFADLFNFGSIRYDLTAPAWAIPYAAFQVSYDTRSGVPGAAQIYNDNAAVVGAGLRFPVGTTGYGYFFAQGGYSFGLRGQRSFPEDRIGFAYSRDYGSTAAPQPHEALYDSVAQYSRFSNTIAYSQGSYDFSIHDFPMRPIAEYFLALDTQRLYYNNYANLYGGVLVRGSASWNLRTEVFTGNYLGRGLALPENHGYRGIRVLGVFGAGFR